tara:strand:+ start:84757 stop:85089 length:333 start_codon:yes stop_codon:yes gene_type:complete
VPRIAQIIALVVAYMMAPGVSELSENAVHLVIHGDTAHSGEADHEESTSTDEHGCSGSFHVCSCCHATIDLSRKPVSEPGIMTVTNQGTMSPDPMLDNGFRHGVFRPPIA